MNINYTHMDLEQYAFTGNTQHIILYNKLKIYMIISHTEQPQVGPTHFLNNVLKLFKVRAPFISWGNVFQRCVP